MAFNKNMLDTYITVDNITLREWIHKRIREYFIPDIDDKILDSMSPKHLTELVDALIDF